MKNGAISVTGGASFTTSGGTLDGVTLSGNLTVQDNSTLNVKNGLTLNNANLILATGGSLTRVNFVGTQTLGGTGQVVFAGTSSPNYHYVQ